MVDYDKAADGWPERTFKSPFLNPKRQLPHPTAEQKHAYMIGLLEAVQVIGGAMLLGETAQSAYYRLFKVRDEMKEIPTNAEAVAAARLALLESFFESVGPAAVIVWEGSDDDGV